MFLEHYFGGHALSGRYTSDKRIEEQTTTHNELRCMSLKENLNQKQPKVALVHIRL